MNAHSQTDAEKPVAEAACSRSNPIGKRIWLLAAIALVAWSCLRFPEAVMTPLPDPSWAGVLVHAHEHAMQFGRDLIFTYGPLGFLSIECFSPQIAVVRMIFEVALGLGIATGLCLLAWRLTVPWRCVWLGFFIFVTSPLHWGGGALFLDLGLFAWGLVCFLECGDRLKCFVLPLAVLAAIGALVKFTFLVTGVFTIALVAGDFALRGRRGLAAGLIVTFVLTFILGWRLLGQNISELGVFLSNSYSIASGYNEAMGLHAISTGWILMMAIATLAAVRIRAVFIAIDGGGPPGFRSLLLQAWIIGLLFVNWKYGCVRTDYDHVAVLLGFMPLMALAAEAMPTAARGPILASRGVGLACTGIALIIIHTQIHGFFPTILVKHAGKNMAKSLITLVQPARYLREKTEALPTEEKQDQLPKIRATVGRASIDVFGQNQGFALLNDLNYQPRPVFQSYTAYTRPLMELNEHYYLSKDAPEYVLFNLHAMDFRFPPLEDALVLRDCLLNYELATNEADFLVLRRKSTAPAQLTLIKEGLATAGKKIDLHDQGETNLWLEIDLQPTLTGRIRQLLYKPPETQMVLWSQSELAPAIIFNAPACMLATGFLASPVELDNRDVVKFFTGGKVLRPDAFSIVVAPGEAGMWEPQIHFRLYRIEGAASPH